MIKRYAIVLLSALCSFAPLAVQAQGWFGGGGGGFNLFGGPPQYRPQEFEPPRTIPRRPRLHPHPHPSAMLPKPGIANAKPGTPVSPPDEPPPPYEPQLLRLSELLGALTYLQHLCGSQDAQIWRDKMSALMDAETQNASRRSRLAGAYNRGFNGYELSYRECTSNAKVVIGRFLDETGKIARDVTHRYGTS